MNFDRLCLWCMHETLENGVCSHCGMGTGWKQEPPFALPPGTILHGRYMVGRVLGHGGFGITYLAADLQEEKTVAIKEYLPSGLCTRQAGSTQVKSTGEQEDFRYGLEKFLDEARTIYQLQGIRGIITVEKLYEENGTAYYTMEFLDGGDLRHRLDAEGGKLPWQEVLTLLHPVFTALEQVHRAGITHRDISPDNIFLCRDGSVKLLDFGAARSMLQGRSQSVDVILKRGYAPEEQYYTRGHQGPWTDVYALGCTIYHCITGCVPPEATERAYRDECKPAAELCPGLPERVNEALKKAMAVEAGFRFGNVTDFRCALYGEIPGPDPGPQPDPDPAPQPNPYTVPDPGPQPGPGPIPQPGPNPVPQPNPYTVPNPGPQPGPGPIPQPGPYPGPQPGPYPAPHPAPAPRQGLLSRFLAWLRRLFGGRREQETAAIQGVAGCFAGLTFPVQGTLVLGRSPQFCQLIFPPEAPGVSRVHCQVSYQPDSHGVFLQDLGSAWGTWLAGGACLKNNGRFLRAGELFILGEGNQFVVVIRKEAVR